MTVAAARPAGPAGGTTARRVATGLFSVRTVGIALVVATVVAYLCFRTTAAADSSDAAAFRFFTGVRDWVDANRDTNPIFLFGVNYLRLGVKLLTDAVASGLTGLGFGGLVAVAGAIGFVLGGWRSGLLALAGFLGFGLLGLWDESVETLSLTISAVLIAVLFGVPIGVLAARVRWVGAVLRPLLDVMQILPTFAYLAPMTLLFLIGSPAAVVVTLIYAIPVTIRITELGIGGVPATTIEAAEAQGSTTWQVLTKVRLPMARPTLVLAVNQTIMMALAMVAITALIDGPGLGVNILRALERVNVGAAFDAGVAIVLMAIVLDRVTSAAAKRRRTDWRIAAPVVIAALITAIVGINPTLPEWSFAEPVNDLTHWVEINWYDGTEWLKNTATTILLNPLENVLTTTPWWLFTLVVLAFGMLFAGWRAALIAGACAAGLTGLGLYQHAMQTLANVLVATVLTLLAGITGGVLCARHDRLATVVRPVLDAAQTMPSFVYLLPAVALFGATRFTAIVAAVIFAVPPVVRLVERGVRDVPATVVEAALSAGSTPRQLLWKVQLPMARGGLLLAANQGIVMVLSMVVVGGLVGAGALGYDVVAGFSQHEDFGKGLAAGFAIVLLGVLLDRLTQGFHRAAGRGSS
ncbi:ABC transporter permease subunit [Actinoplanes sp. NPDC051851]|uniref:ABC transporter permease n=1 Tax=Actinoplanes sp. NPDC051851 TaxID=3154753 RepID=UPI00341FE91D